jgi:hypothetical protein
MQRDATKPLAIAEVADHRLDWRRNGLSPRAERVSTAVLSAVLCDEDDDGHLVPPDPATIARSVAILADTVGRGSADLRRGFNVLAFVMEWLPIFVIGKASRASALPLAQRLAYLEALESSRIGWLPMLLVAFKVPAAIPAFEEGAELAETGYDRPHTAARRKLPLASAPRASASGPTTGGPAGDAQEVSA